MRAGDRVMIAAQVLAVHGAPEPRHATLKLESGTCVTLEIGDVQSPGAHAADESAAATVQSAVIAPNRSAIAAEDPAAGGGN